MFAPLSAWQPHRFAHPAFAGVVDLLARVAPEPDWPSVAQLEAALAPELGAIGVRLVEAGKTKASLGPDGAIDPATLYEVRIAERGEIPTRPRNAHDLFNAIIWAAFPLSKRSLTRALAVVQRERAAGRDRLPGTRTRAHDRLALVDEGGLVFVGDSAPWVFGHALLEHVYSGTADVRGAAIDLHIPGEVTRAAIDRVLAAADLATVVRPGAGIPLALT